MAFTYVDTLLTDLDKARFYVGDTDSAAPLFSDAEIYGVLADQPSPLSAAAVLAETQAAKYSRRASISIDGASFQYRELADNFRMLASRLRAQAVISGDGGLGKPFIGGISRDAMQTQREDTDRDPNRLTEGMHDFPGSVITPMDDPKL